MGDMEMTTGGAKSPTKEGEVMNLGDMTEGIQVKAEISETADDTSPTGAENIEIVENLTGNIETGVAIGGRVPRKTLHVIAVGLDLDMEAGGAAKGMLIIIITWSFNV